MTLSKNRTLRVFVMLAVVVSMFILFGLTAKAQAAEYKNIYLNSYDGKVTVNGVKCTITRESVGSGSDYCYVQTIRFGDQKVVAKSYYYDSSKGFKSVTTAFTNGSTVYYTLQDQATQKTIIYKLNLSTGTKTKIKTFSNNAWVCLAGIYGDNIYYTTDMYDYSFTSGSLKCYNKKEKTTRTLYKSMDLLPNASGRYIYFKSSNAFKIVDTHTGKTVRTITSWPNGESYGGIVGVSGSKVVFTTAQSLCTMSLSGANREVVYTWPQNIGWKGKLVGSYYYVKDYSPDAESPYYKININDKTKTKVSREVYAEKTGDQYA